jgi:hypothetical protein
MILLTENESVFNLGIDNSPTLTCFPVSLRKLEAVATPVIVI